MLLLLLACAGAEPDADTAADPTSDTDAALDTATWGPAPDPWCAEPSGDVSYTPIAESWGLAETADGDPSLPEVHPVALADLDGDGLDDVVIAQRFEGLLVQLNLGGALAEPVVASDATELTGLALGDVDGDGDLDIWTSGYTEHMFLLLNDGAGGFTDASEASGVAAIEAAPQKQDAAFADFDGDGDLDLFVNFDTAPGFVDDPEYLDKLLVNDGSGVFTDASELLPSRVGIGWSSAWTDLDLDGDLELFTANADQARSGMYSRLLRNDGSDGAGGWSFVDVSDDCFCTDNNNPMGVSPADYDNDGLFDLFLSNTGSNQLLKNAGDDTFIDVSAAVGAMDMASVDHMSFGSAWLDYDNDGWQDLYIAAGPHNTPEPADQPDLFLVGDGAGFTDAAPSLGLDDSGAGRGVAFGMLNDDGFPELLISEVGDSSRLYLASCTSARALVIELEGVESNRFGIGARIVVEADGAVMSREVTTKTGWGGAIHPRAWFGLGEAAIDAVTIYWPSGGVQSIEVHPMSDGRLLVVEE